MAKTTFTTNDPLTKKAWEEKLFRDSRKEAYFSKFMGKGNESIVHETTELSNGKGDKVTFGIRMRLQGAGVTSGQVLEGNEEKLTTYDYSLELEQYRHAVRDDGEMSRKRAMFEITDEARSAIRDWQGEKIDQLCFDALFTSPSKTFYKTAAGVLATGTPATAKTAIDATNSKLTLGTISFIKAHAKTGGNRANVPLRPVKIGGKTYYVLLVHPDAAYDLKRDSEWQAAQRDAAERGSDNPLFTGMIGVWDGVIVHEHENCLIGTDAGAGSNVAWAKGKFLGAQALCWGWGKRPELITEKFDYENEIGIATTFICKAGKPVFNSLDYGSYEVIVARSNVAGA